MAAGNRSVVEITSRWLKVARAQKSGRGLVLSACTVQDISGSTDLQVVALLKGMRTARQMALPGDQIVLVIPRRHAVMKILHLPSQDEQELRAMVELQSPQHTPYSREELAVDYLLLERDAAGYSRVLVFMVPVMVLERYRAVCVAAGCTPSQVTLSSAGLAQWLQRVARGPVAGVVGLWDVDMEAAEFGFFRGVDVLFSRQVLRDEGAAPDVRMAELGRQYEMTLRAYDQEGGVQEPAHIIPSMPGMDLKAIVSPQHTQGVLLHAGTMPARRLLSGKLVWPPEVLGGEVSVAAVCGVALYLHRVPVDLAQADYRVQENRGLMRRAAWRAALLALAGVVALGLALSLPFMQKNTELSRLEQQLRALKPAVARVKAKFQEVHELEVLAAGRMRVPMAVREVTRLVNNDIVLVVFDISEDGLLAMEGYSVAHEAVNAFRDTMGASALFTDVRIEYINKRVVATGEVNYFKITCQMKGDA